MLLCFRYTPFGDGLVTLVEPTFIKSEMNLMLWNAEKLERPAHTYTGHKEMIVEFCWRNKNTSKLSHTMIFLSRVLNLLDLLLL